MCLAFWEERGQEGARPPAAAAAEPGRLAMPEKAPPYSSSQTREAVAAEAEEAAAGRLVGPRVVGPA